MSINRPVLLIIAGAALAAAATLAVPAWRHLHEVPPQLPAALRLTLAHDFPSGVEDLTLSPDGRRLAFSALRAGRGGTSQLWVRDLTTGEPSALPETENGALPFWSRDGHQLGFFADGRLKVLTLETRQMADLAEARSPRGGTWDGNGGIVFSPGNEGGLMRRRADGTIEPLTTPDAAHGETSHRFPLLSDDGRYLLYFVRAAETQRSGIWIARLDNLQQRARLAGSTANGLLSGNWLIYAREDALLAQQLSFADDDALPSIVGRQQLLGTPVGQTSNNQLTASAAADAIVFAAPQPQLREIRWIDRHDATASTLASGVDGWDVRIAPGGGGVAMIERDRQLGSLDVHVYEGGRMLPRRISQAIGADESAIWSRDGSRLAWVQAQRSITVRGALAQLPEQTVRKFETPIRLWDWSPDGARFVVGYARPGTREDIFLVDANGSAEPVPYAQAAFNETYAAISPDGRWIAYASDESGQPEIYVDAFPKPGQRARLSIGGGNEPRWSGSGTEVFFRRGSEIHVAAVSFKDDTPFAASTTRVADAGGEIRSFDVSPDGRRVLVNVPAPGAKPQPINVVVNWRSLLALESR